MKIFQLIDKLLATTQAARERRGVMKTFQLTDKLLTTTQAAMGGGGGGGAHEDISVD